jgi:hypothetical protein
MFWEFPLKVQTLNTQTNEQGYRTFETKEELEHFVESQFLIPGEYHLRNTIRWQDAGTQYTKTNKESGREDFMGGYYIKAVKKSHRWNSYWNNEKERVKVGIIIDGTFVPPFYYWYLNFCPIFDEVLKKKRFGDVWDSDLWFFQYIMLCLLKGKHAVVVKARQRGYTLKIMSLLYWSYCWKGGTVNTIGASQEDFAKKSWRFLEFYRQHINAKTNWRRGPVLPKSLEWIERTYKVDGSYGGNDAKLAATTFQKSPENGVGGGQTIFFYEEAGIAPTLLQTVGFVRPSLERGTRTTGLIIISGAIGDLDDCKDLKEVFYNPLAHNFLSVNNIWDKKERAGKPCGLFVSEAYNLEGFIDKDGNSLVNEALEWIRENNERVKNTKRKDLAQLDISQKPISPEDAFAQRKQNEFPVEDLRRQQERIEIKDQENGWERRPIKCTLFEDDKGVIQMNLNNLPEEHRYPINPEWEDKRGIVTIYELPPERPIWLTYFAGVDTVEVDETTTSNSVMSVDIYKRMVKVRGADGKIRYEGGKIVATYRGRYNPVEKGNEQAWFLIKMFNAFTYQERSKPNFMNYMKRMGRAEKYLAKESDVPMFKDMNHNNNLSKSAYGFILSPHNQVWSVFKANVKEYFTQEFGRLENENGELTKMFTGIDRIDDKWLLEEYIQYNESDNFDRIISSAAAITIGKTYENEYGIPTIDETPQKPKKELYKQPRQVNMLGGGQRTPRPGIPRRPGKTKSLL